MSLPNLKLSNPINTHKEVDTRGMRCPMPLLRAKQMLKDMQTGELVRVWATDPTTKVDFDAMLSHLPHELVEYERFDGLAGDFPRIDVFIIRKGAD